MCGICGKIAFKNNYPVTREDLTAMRDSMALRGPDDAGVYLNERTGLGHRRLSIIDLEGSKQPLCNEDQTIWIVFNGEIYNFKELRNDLIKQGHQFKTAGDTEVIVHLYEQYGVECVKWLRGMFAFAIYDNNRRELFIARDRVGIKPLHYYSDTNVFIFGSEIKAILADKYYGSKKTMDLEAFHCYFSFLYTPAPLTMFKGIKKLLPAHWMKVNQDGQITTKQYWNVHYSSEQTGYSEAEYCEHLRELLKESVKIRLISDVPLGAFLSGGMDSSAVVAAMAQVNNSSVKTFSIGFASDKYNEADDAREVARHFDTDHTEMILEPVDIIKELQTLIAYFDEPFADSSLLPTYLVSRLAREKVTVALSGDGGDELFGGYPWWQKRPAYQLKMNQLPKFARSLIAFLAPLIPQGVRGKHFLKKVNLPYERYLLEAKAVCDIRGRELLYSGKTMAYLKSIDPYQYNLPYLVKPDDQEWSDRIMEYDLKTYIPNDILTKVDRMSMFCSLEARVPLLDHKMVEFAAQIPSELKLKGNISKYILKKSMEPYLPERILYKPKQGFSIPLEDWLRTDLKEQMSDALLTQNNDLFNKQHIEMLVKNFIDGNDTHKHLIWELFTFQSWYASHFS